MEICVRGYTEADVSAMCAIWNEVVREGKAFPQEEELTAVGNFPSLNEGEFLELEGEKE